MIIVRKAEGCLLKYNKEAPLGSTVVFLKKKLLLAGSIEADEEKRREERTSEDNTFQEDVIS